LLIIDLYSPVKSTLPSPEASPKVWSRAEGAGGAGSLEIITPWAKELIVIAAAISVKDITKTGGFICCS
jgi:hypothetical protein